MSETDNDGGPEFEVGMWLALPGQAAAYRIERIDRVQALLFMAVDTDEAADVVSFEWARKGTSLLDVGPKEPKQPA